MQKFRHLKHHVPRHWRYSTYLSQPRCVVVRSPVAATHVRLKSAHSYTEQALWSPLNEKIKEPLVYTFSQCSEAELLERGVAYGFSSIDDIRQASTFIAGHANITDSEPYRSDIALWQLFLDHGIWAARQPAADGISNTISQLVHALMYRSAQVDLNADDEDITRFWLTLLHEVTINRQLDNLKLLCRPGRSVWNRTDLFPEVGAMALRNMSKMEAVETAGVLLTQRHPSVKNGNRLFELYAPETTEDIDKFKAMYLSCDFTGLYDQVMPQLYARGRVSLAPDLHRFLAAQQDYPTSVDAVRPLLAHIAGRGEALEPYMASLRSAGVSIALEAESMCRAETSAPRSGLDRSTPVSVSDTFAAKAFATRNLSLAFVLSSLKAFGYQVIEPQALREIGLGSKGTKDFAERLALAQSLGITTGPGKYSRLVHKTCQSGNESLLRSILDTDMHHDVFDDRDLQVRLLHEAFRRSEWERVNLLLFSLNEGNLEALTRSVKQIVVDVAMNTSPRSLLGLLLSDTDQQSSYTSDSDYMVGQRLYTTSSRANSSPSQRDTATQPSPRMQTLVTAGLVQHAAASGIAIKPGYWTALLTRLVVHGDLDMVHHLCLWIPDKITQRLQPEAGDDKEHDESRSVGHVLDAIFTRRFQTQYLRATLRRHLRTRNPSDRDKWKQCLKILYHLHRNHAVHIDEASLKRSVVDYSREFMPRYRLGELGPHYAQACRFCAEVLHYMYSLFRVPSEMAEAQTQRALKHIFSTRRVRRLGVLAPQAKRTFFVSPSVLSRLMTWSQHQYYNRRKVQRKLDSPLSESYSGFDRDRRERRTHRPRRIQSDRHAHFFQIQSDDGTSPGTSQQL